MAFVERADTKAKHSPGCAGDDSVETGFHDSACVAADFGRGSTCARTDWSTAVRRIAASLSTCLVQFFFLPRQRKHIPSLCTHEPQANEALPAARSPPWTWRTFSVSPCRVVVSDGSILLRLGGDGAPTTKRFAKELLTAVHLCPIQGKRKHRTLTVSRPKSAKSAIAVSEDSAAGSESFRNQLRNVSL